MKVKAVMIPYHEMKCISLDDTLKEAMRLIDENNLLSMPVVRGKSFIGVLSKQYVCESYFKEFTGTREEFLAQKVQTMMKTKLEPIGENAPIEEAAARFIATKFRFIPVVDENEELVGIVTQQAIFKEYQKIYGSGYDSFTIYSYDYKGTLAKISEVISKAGGDIKNIVIINTETMGLQEFFIRVESGDFDALVAALRRKGFDVRNVERASGK